MMDEQSSAVAEKELADVCSHASAESSKENVYLVHSSQNLVADSGMLPMLASQSPTQLDIRHAPPVLGVRRFELESEFTDHLDPTLSPDNPDCGLRWSLTSPCFGFLQQATFNMPSNDQAACAVASVGEAPGSLSASPKLHANSIRTCNGSSETVSDGSKRSAPVSADQQESCELLACSTPPTQHACNDRLHQIQDSGWARARRSVHAAASPQHSVVTPSVRYSSRAIHVSPGRIAPSRACSCEEVAGGSDWVYQLPERTPFHIASRLLHAAVSSQGIGSQVRGLGLMSSGPQSWYHIYPSSEQKDRNSVTSIVVWCCKKLWQVLWLDVQLLLQCIWEEAILAWKTAIIPEESWILLQVFGSLLGIYWCESIPRESCAHLSHLLFAVFVCVQVVINCTDLYDRGKHGHSIKCIAGA